LSFARNKSIIRNVTVDNIPDELTFTERAKTAADMDIWKDELFLQLSNATDGEKMLVFFADADIISIIKAADNGSSIEFYADGS